MWGLSSASPPLPIWGSGGALGPSWGLHSCARVGAGAGGGGQGLWTGSWRPSWQRQGLGTPTHAGTGAFQRPLRDPVQTRSECKSASSHLCVLGPNLPALLSRPQA